LDIAAEDALWRPVGLADVPVLEEFAAARLSVRVRVDVPRVAEMPTPWHSRMANCHVSSAVSTQRSSGVGVHRSFIARHSLRRH
jgi:hypothetical protein